MPSVKAVKMGDMLGAGFAKKPQLTDQSHCIASVVR